MAVGICRLIIQTLRTPKRVILFVLLVIGVYALLGSIFMKGHYGNNLASGESTQVEGALKFVTHKTAMLATNKACKLPAIDPEHPKVMVYIKDIGPLRCPGSTFSRFDKDVLTVQGDGILSVKYWTIVRPEGDDFDRKRLGPKTVVNTLVRNKKKSKPKRNFLEPGKNIFQKIFLFTYTYESKSGRPAVLQ